MLRRIYLFLVSYWGFVFCGCSEGFLRGFVLGVPPSRKASADKCSGVLLWLFVGLVLGFWSELKCGLSPCSQIMSIVIFYFSWRQTTTDCTDDTDGRE